MKHRSLAFSLTATLALTAATLAAFGQLVLKQTPATAVPASPQKPASLSPDPKTNYAVTQTLTIGGDGLWTNITLDAAGKFLYIPRTTHTQVIDTATGKIAADIAPEKGANALALVPDASRGFITNTADGTLTVFDLKTNAVLGSIPVGQNPTAITYDPLSKHLFVACAPNTIIPVPANIDLKTGKPDPAITCDDAVGGLVADNQGMVYATVPAKDEVAVLDTRVMKIATTWPLGDWHGPGAISMDRTHGRLFVSYRANVAVMSAVDGHVMGEILLRPTQPWKYPNSVTEYYDDHVFSACGDGTMTVLGQNPDGNFEVQQMFPLEADAHPLAIDPHTGKIYLPAIKMDRNKPVPGSFKILVVEKKPL